MISDALPAIRKIMRQYQPPLGRFAVLGNHDFYGGARELVALLRSFGIRVLLDESVQLPRGSESISLAGIVDSTGRVIGLVPDYKQAFAEIPDKAFVIALAHDPKAYEQLRRYEPALTTSGHVHKVPAVIKGLKAQDKGLYRDASKVLFVSAGLGTVGLSPRIWHRPEITVIRLSSSRPAHKKVRS